MDTRTRNRVKEEIVRRAGEKPAFRTELLRDPRQAIVDEFGIDPPDNLAVHVLEDTADDFYIVLPAPPPNRDSVVTLREVTRDNVRAICALEVREDQRGFVAPNSFSLAEGSVTPTAWYRAIYADETPVGFVMLNEEPEKPRYYLWRYMIGGEYQKLGFGRRALEQVIEHVRTHPGATELLLSFVPGEGSPRDFYARLGFEETGAQHFTELEMRLDLRPADVSTNPGSMM
jgi:diamine N-acetyltransferase